MEGPGNNWSVLWRRVVLYGILKGAGSWKTGRSFQFPPNLDQHTPENHLSPYNAKRQNIYNCCEYLHLLQTAQAIPAKYSYTCSAHSNVVLWYTLRLSLIKVPQPQLDWDFMEFVQLRREGGNDRVQTHVNAGSEDPIGVTQIDLYFCSLLNTFNLDFVFV